MISDRQERRFEGSPRRAEIRQRIGRKLDALLEEQRDLRRVSPEFVGVPHDGPATVSAAAAR